MVVRLVRDELPVLPLDSVVVYDTICRGDSIAWQGRWFKTAGLYRGDTVAKDDSCQVHFLQLTIREHDTVIVDYDTLCAGGVCSKNGILYPNAGTFFVPLDTNDCHIEMKYLIVLPLDSVVVDYDTLCQDANYPNAGTFFVPLDTNDCHVEMLQLTVLPLDSVIVDYDTLCQDATYPNAGTFLVPIDTNADCQVNMLQLTVLPLDSVIVDYDTLCQDATYPNAGTFLVPIDTNDCQVEMLQLSVLPLLGDTLQATICAGEQYTLNNRTYTQAGLYPLDTNDCRIQILHLTIREPLGDTLQATICVGEQYSLNNRTYTQAGLYPLDTSDCRIQMLHLTVREPLRDTLQATICVGEQYSLNNRTYTQAGLYPLDTIDCRIQMLHLQVQAALSDTLTVHLCDGGYSGRKSYTLNGKEYRATGRYIDTLKTVAGCDSVVVLDLQVQPAYFDTILELVPYGGSWVWHDSTFDRGGFFIDWEHSVYGCDSVTTHRVRFQSPYETTATLEVPEEKVRVRKVLENGHILIFIDDRKYNIIGQAVK